jgi:hypothetical protein
VVASHHEPWGAAIGSKALAVTHGKINHPSCWPTDHGLAAFFWTWQAGRPPVSYSLPAARLREMLKMLIREVRVTRTGVRTPPDIKVIPVRAEDE